ncbi:hypothetical protein IE4803_CH00508 [Rhizobium etli bv. phaseoli str. IE4803]|nr:hypothetical protein IE4803_CH00508 [Rhizobium etli bv. phaseoli str. IE4803]
MVTQFKPDSRGSRPGMTESVVGILAKRGRQRTETHKNGCFIRPAITILLPVTGTGRRMGDCRRLHPGALNLQLQQDIEPALKG